MRKLAIMAAVFTAAIVSGCSKDGAAVPTDPTDKFGNPAEVTVTIINKSDAVKADGDKEYGTDEENKITILEFYVFDDTGNTLDPGVGEDGKKGYVRISGTALGLNHKIRVSAGDDKKFIVVANADLGAPASDDTYDKIIAKLSKGEFKATAGGSDHNSRNIPVAGFEMTGTTKATIIEERTNQVYVTVTRLVSKINTPIIPQNIPVNFELDEQYEQVWGENHGIDPASTITFEFKGYAVVNGLDKSSVMFTGNDSGNYYYPKTILWDTWSYTGKNYLNSSFVQDETAPEYGQYTNNYSGKQGTEWFLDGNTNDKADRVYVYENKAKPDNVNGVPGYSLESTYAYIIKGTLKVEDKEPATRYWRVDLTKDEVFHIMRNHVYKVTISKITTPGYGTPQEAEEEPGIVPDPDDTLADFVINVARWDIKEYETEI